MTLPKAVYSQLGPVPVAVRNKIRNGNPFGMFWYGMREIEVHTKQSEASQLATLAHEMVHVALYDSGVEEGLNENALEAVCNAVGTYIAGAVQAGYIVLKTPK
jgi:Zn-dependent peptidase ImmA (M78 family)